MPKGSTAAPAVLLNALPEPPVPLPSVLPDEVEAGRAAARVLLDAGHRDGIHLIGAGPGARDVPAGERRGGGAARRHPGGARRGGRQGGGRPRLPRLAAASTAWPRRGTCSRTHPAARADLLQRPARDGRLPGARRLRPARCRRTSPSSPSTTTPSPRGCGPKLTTVALPHYELGPQGRRRAVRRDRPRPRRRATGRARCTGCRCPSAFAGRSALRAADPVVRRSRPLCSPPALAPGLTSLIAHNHSPSPPACLR